MNEQYAFQYRVYTGEFYDGDTWKGSVDLGFRINVSIDLRINGLDTPEIRPLVSREAATIVKNMCSQWIIEKNAVLVTESNLDKYGRALGTFVDSESGITLTEYLIENKLAKPYSGGTKQDWTTSELDYIVRTFQT